MNPHPQPAYTSVLGEYQVRTLLETALTICCETVKAVPLISPNPHPQIWQLRDSTSWGSRK
jgi:hypothetical protein